MDGLRATFFADQHAHAALLQSSQSSRGLTSDNYQVNDITASNAQSADGQYVGWGGQAIPQGLPGRVPCFGRNRRTGIARQQPALRNDSGPRGPMESSGILSRSSGPSHETLSAEDVLGIIQRLNKVEKIPEHVYNGFYYFDSRAVSVLLKELSKIHLSFRAVEIFDYLRHFDSSHTLSNLCDVYTYTAMISMCIYNQAVDRALDLMEDMRLRNIERNVHTYTALMNVCIKCGKLTQALDIYHDMRAVGCTPNAVTFNTLIDVYGKLGQWEKAASVLQTMKSEGVPPVLRTYNTLIIACNMCNQPREALAVYYQMLSEGFPANSTTYNALISAYGKTGQLEKALEVYHEMQLKNCERSVITYSSLISACEKAGKWELAMKLFDEMQCDGCVPNTVTYNSLIAACAQGAQWEKAARIFEQMQSQGCSPDVVTYTALISAFERAGQWEMALKAFQQMCIQGCKPDAIVYNAIIDALWETGLAWAQQKALQLFKTAIKQNHFNQQQIDRHSPRVDLNLHAMTAGVAMLSLYTWLLEIRSLVQMQSGSALPPKLLVITDKGKTSKEQGNYVIKEAVATMMAFWEAPFRLAQDTPYGGALEADSRAVAQWVCSNSFEAQLASIFVTCNNTTKGNAFSDDEAGTKQEMALESQCQQAFLVVKNFEGTRSLSLQHMGMHYLHMRPALVDQLLQQGAGLQLKDEVVHDAVLLMDRTVSCSASVPEELLPLVSAAALSLSLKQGENEERQPSEEEVERVTKFSSQAILKMEYNIRNVLNDDTAAISTMRCLRLYLERLGNSFLEPCSQHATSGLALLLVTESLYDTSLLNCRPSVVAAAILYAERRLRGSVPFWPSMLAKLTGYHDMTTPELIVAVRTAQKLCRSLQCASLYREQTCALASLSRVPPSLNLSSLSSPRVPLYSPSKINHQISSAALPVAVSSMALMASDSKPQAQPWPSHMRSELRSTHSTRLRTPQRHPLHNPSTQGLLSMNDLDQQLAAVQASLRAP